MDQRDTLHACTGGCILRDELSRKFPRTIRNFPIFGGSQEKRKKNVINFTYLIYLNCKFILKVIVIS